MKIKDMIDFWGFELDEEAFQRTHVQLRKCRVPSCSHSSSEMDEWEFVLEKLEEELSASYFNTACPGFKASGNLTVLVNFLHFAHDSLLGEGALIACTLFSSWRSNWSSIFKAAPTDISEAERFEVGINKILDQRSEYLQSMLNSALRLPSALPLKAVEELCYVRIMSEYHSIPDRLLSRRYGTISADVIIVPKRAISRNGTNKVAPTTSRRKSMNKSSDSDFENFNCTIAENMVSAPVPLEDDDDIAVREIMATLALSMPLAQAALLARNV